MLHYISRNHTGAVQVGSWLYMAPEMVSGDKYSEKVDVYSLAVMLYEALSFRLNVMRLAMGQEPQAISDYAQKVADGHREKVPKNWPEPVRQLLEDAWHQVRLTLQGCLLPVTALHARITPGYECCRAVSCFILSMCLCLCAVHVCGQHWALSCRTHLCESQRQSFCRASVTSSTAGLRATWRRPASPWWSTRTLIAAAVASCECARVGACVLLLLRLAAGLTCSCELRGH